MSKTDNTDPFAIRLQHAKPGQTYVWHECVYRVIECDIGVDPITEYTNVPVNSRRNQCGPTFHYRVYVGGIPRWFRNAYWFAPERQRERVDLDGMRREYNHYGDIEDDDFPNRDSVRDLWWKWC
jgi:hypothetical protein